MDKVSEPPVPLRARHENGGTPVMTSWYLSSETGPLKRRAARPGRKLPLDGHGERRLVVAGARHDAQGLQIRQAAGDAPAPRDGRRLRGCRRHLPFPARRRCTSLPGLCARFLVHDALWRRHLPARQSAAAGRICSGPALLPRERHPDLRHGERRQLRRRRLQHHPPRRGAGRLHRSSLARKSRPGRSPTGSSRKAGRSSTPRSTSSMSIST